MSRRLLVVNLLLLAVAIAASAYAVHELWAPAGARAGRVVPAVASHSRPVAATEPTTPDGSYGVVAGRNLFSPTRTEVAAAAVRPSAAPVAKPNLYGVVLRDEGSIAYLENPVTKRVARYRVGDSVAGGTVQSIAADHVVLARGDETVEVRLNDPSKPRVAVATPAGAAPPGSLVGAGPQPGAASVASTPPIFVPRQRLRGPFAPKTLPTRPEGPAQQ
jgi:hypothetical protein